MLDLRTAAKVCADCLWLRRRDSAAHAKPGVANASSLTQPKGLSTTLISTCFPLTCANTFLVL